jgi:hypothetical protein
MDRLIGLVLPHASTRSETDEYTRSTAPKFAAGVAEAFPCMDSCGEPPTAGRIAERDFHDQRHAPTDGGGGLYQNARAMRPSFPTLER